MSERGLETHLGEVGDMVLVEKPDSSKNNEDFSIISIGANDERIMIKDYKTGFNNDFSLVLPKMRISNLFANQKMQLIKTSDDEYKIIVINQSEAERNLYIMTFQDSRLASRKF
jgi:hypothetical protein